MIYLGNFVYLTNQQETSELDRRHGEFSLIVQAESSEGAIELFRERIIETRESSQMFEGQCRVFFIQMLEMDAVPSDQALLLNFKSVAGDPAMPHIRCTVPEGNQQVCRIFDWKNNRPEIDGQDEKLFMAFDG